MTEIAECSETPYYFGEGFDRVNLKPIDYDVEVGTIKYTGETLTDEDGKTVKYSVGIEEHVTKGDYSFDRKSKGFKMSVNGLMYIHDQRRDFGTRITRPEKVLELILEDIECRKNSIERSNAKQSLDQKALAQITERYPDAEVEESSVKYYGSYKDGLSVKFDNGVTVKLYYHEDYNNEDEPFFKVVDIDLPSNGLVAVDFLGKLKF